MNEKKYWSYYDGMKQWIRIDADGCAYFAKDARVVGHFTRLPLHATSDEAPRETPVYPSDLKRIEVTVEMVVSMKMTKNYSARFSPDQLYFSIEQIEENYHSVEYAGVRVMRVSGFDKKYQCQHCEEQATDEYPHAFQLCRCGGLGRFKAWTPKQVWKVGDVVTPEVAC